MRETDAKFEPDTTPEFAANTATNNMSFVVKTKTLPLEIVGADELSEAIIKVLFLIRDEETEKQ